jgi:glycosyltransferase involved in cell wall biosynthesis
VSAIGAKKRAAQKVAVIITNFNYADHIEAAIRSVLRQTHQNFEIVVVDDHSAPAAWAKTARLVKALRDDRITLVRNKTNLGQTHSFYIGLDHSSAEFVCLLDPDDRYFPEFLATMLAAHLNPIHIAPLAFSNQQMTRGEQAQLTGNQSALLVQECASGKLDNLEASLARLGFSALVTAATPGWIWISTSSMMFRRDAVEMIRPTKQLAHKRDADAYLANGTHLLGGSLFVHKVLLSRTIHTKNHFSARRIFASDQIWGTSIFKAGGPGLDAIEALFESGNYKLMRRKKLQAAMAARLRPVDIMRLRRRSRNFRADFGGILIFLRSISKRLFGK